MTIVPVKTPPPSTQDLINGQVAGKYDVTAGDYVTYIEDQLGAAGAPRNDLRIIAEASFLQPNVLTVLVNGHSQISQVSQSKHRRSEGSRASLTPVCSVAPGVEGPGQLPFRA